MKTDNINVTMGSQKEAHLFIHETDYVEKKLPILEPKEVDIRGNITSIVQFLSKRWEAESDTSPCDLQIDHNRTHLLVDRDILTMQLICNETDARNQMTVIGSIQLSRQYETFGINSYKSWNPIKLAELFRINRTYFTSKEENMKLVSLLKNFTAKISTEVAKVASDNGSLTDIYRKVVDSTIPEAFTLVLPIWKGAKPETIEVQVIADVNGKDISLMLVSPDAQAILEESRDRIIDEQLDIIRKEFSEIPIIEK